MSSASVVQAISIPVAGALAASVVSHILTRDRFRTDWGAIQSKQEVATALRAAGSDSALAAQLQAEVERDVQAHFLTPYARQARRVVLAIQLTAVAVGIAAGIGGAQISSGGEWANAVTGFFLACAIATMVYLLGYRAAIRWRWIQLPPVI